MQLVAIGDSVMWGQGCSDEQKWVELVRRHLAETHGEVDPTLLAHSGAWAAAKPGKANIWGEVPMAGPGVADQLEWLISHGPAPDVLLVDGGINDISAFHIVIANPFDGDGSRDIAAETGRIFGPGGPVEALLTRASGAFPGAAIVVSGYYPIVSPATDLETLVHLLNLFPNASRVVRWLDRWAHRVPNALIARLIASEQDRMVQQCRAFRDGAHASLATLVARLAAGGRRIAFADPGFSDTNAYGAPDSWLWDGANDPLRAEREARYGEEVRRGNPDNWPPFTIPASICHPNAQGAVAYANAVIACLASRQA